MKQFLKHVDQVIAGTRRYAIVQADCLDVGRALPRGVFSSCVIDPPYGMKYQGLEDRRPPIANDERPFVWWLHDAFEVLTDDAALACFCQWKGQEDFATAIRLAGFQIRSHGVWDRMNGGMGATHCTLAPRHDIVWFATKGRFRFPNGRPDSVFPFANVPARQRLHSTQKPDALMQRLVTALTPRGGIVYDPCMGSGSTGAAALAAGYRFVGVELDPANFKTASDRLASVERASNIKAKLAEPIHAYQLQEVA